MNPHPSPGSNRLFFLDWVRIIAFFLLIAYHVGMYYVTWDWHVKSPFASAAIEPFMQMSSPWRLGLLFLVSGVASSAMLAKMGAGAFMRRRSVRLLLPLVFGMMVVVPPQPYFEVVEKFAYQGSYGDFLGLYFKAYDGFCTASGCLKLPTWNHLWFVAYLWVYTLLLGALVLALGARFDPLARRACALLDGWKLFALPVAVLLIARFALRLRFPSTHALFGDWFNHATYFFLFMLGAMLARERSAWPRFDAARWAALGMAVGSWGTVVLFDALPDEAFSPPVLTVMRYVVGAVYVLGAWTSMVAACGFAHRHLDFDSEKRRYLANAVFPVYIVHQTLIVSMAHFMQSARMAPAAEGPILAAMTLCLSFAVVEVVRRCPPLRPLFGLPFRQDADGGGGKATMPLAPDLPARAAQANGVR